MDKILFIQLSSLFLTSPRISVTIFDSDLMLARPWLPKKTLSLSMFIMARKFYFIIMIQRWPCFTFLTFVCFFKQPKAHWLMSLLVLYLARRNFQLFLYKFHDDGLLYKYFLCVYSGNDNSLLCVKDKSIRISKRNSPVLLPKRFCLA